MEELKEKEQEIEKWPVNQIQKEILKIIQLSFLEQEEALEKIARESGWKITQLKKQLKIYQKEEKQKKDIENKRAGKEFTQSQFNLLKLHSVSGNKIIKQAIEEGLEFINLNNNIRATCRSFLSQISKRIQKEKSVKFDYLEAISGREKDWSRATEILRDYIMKEMNIYTTKEDKNSEIWSYCNGIYKPAGKSEIKERLRKLLDQHYNLFIFNKTIEKIEPDTFIDPKDFFSVNYPTLVPVKNGILDIENIELLPFDKNKIFFSKLNAKYNPEAKCPKINEFLKQVLKDEEDIKVFYELAGFGLLKEYRFEKAFMLIGDGRNGKGKSIELIKRLFGVENCCSVPLSSMMADSFFVSELFGKLFNLAGDIGNQDLKDTSMFKSLTGRDLINAHRKFRSDISFENYAKFVFACNELPMVYDMSKGFWDRWILLEFPYTFVNQEEYDAAEDKTRLKIRDPSIIDKITSDEEMSGFLNEAIAGLHRVMNHKKFSSTTGSNEVKSTWIRKSNSFLAYCFDNIESSSNSWVTKKELRKGYSEYCKKHSVSTKSDYVLKRALQDMFGVVDEKREVTTGYWDYVWYGIKFKEGKN